jgi:hypothetical protein
MYEVANNRQFHQGKIFRGSMSSDHFVYVSFGRLINRHYMTRLVLMLPFFWDYSTARTTFVSAPRSNFGQMSILLCSTSSDPFSHISFGRLIHTHSMTRLLFLLPVSWDYSTARTTIVSSSRRNFGQMLTLLGSTSSDPFSHISFSRFINNYSKTRLLL